MDGSAAVTTSPRGYQFDTIVYNVGQMNALHGLLTAAIDATGTMQLVLGNVSNHLEGTGDAVARAQQISGEIGSALIAPRDRLDRLAEILITYGREAESAGGAANRLMADVTEAEAALAAAESAVDEAEASVTSATESAAAAKAAAGDDAPSRAENPFGIGSWGVESAQADLTGAVNAHRRAEEDLDYAWATWEAQYEQWDEAYAAAVAAVAAIDRTYVSAADSVSLSTLADADTPAEVAAVWARLSEAERHGLLARYPDFLGNLEGVPYEYRIAANVAVLEEAAKTAWGEPTDTEIAKLIEEREDHGGLPISLNLFDKNQATAAVLYVEGFAWNPTSFVDPLSGVANVNMLVGGMLTELSQAPDWGKTAREINDAVSDKDGRSATISWFGYDSPNLATVGSMNQAKAGAEVLTNTLRGLNLEAPADAVTTLIAHSYGSTTALLAIGSAETNLGVDRAVAVGSAGLSDEALGTDPGRGLDFSGTEVFATTAPEDVWARKGRWLLSEHPVDPGSLPGVTVFDSDGGYTPNSDGTEPSAEGHDSEYLIPTPGHGTRDEGDWPFLPSQPGGYLDPGSESFANVREIIVGGAPLTTAGGYGSDTWWAW